MILHFTKMEGLGNDYVYVDCLNHMLANVPEIARRISDRHYGVGADGLILICPSKRADFMMDMYNADGSRSKMCGNGIRCVGKYVYEHHLTNKKKLTIETLSGVKYLKLITDKDGSLHERVKAVTVNMGAPVFKPGHIPVALDRKVSIVKDEPVMIHGAVYNITCVSMGNPHCIIYTDDIDSVPLHEVGPYIENAGIFPERVNVSFVQTPDLSHIRMRVWERGTGETLACGTGACAALVAGVINNRTDRRADVSLKGGHLIIRWDEDKNCVYMTGPANTVYDGVIHI